MKFLFSKQMFVTVFVAICIVFIFFEIMGNILSIIF